MDIETRFLKRVKKTSKCWEWIGYKNKKGYGSFLGLNETLAHRFSYKFYKGEIPEGMFVCHSCDNPSCVNPEHLWVGNNSDNQLDCSSKGRARRNSPVGEKNGLSKLKESDILKIKKLSGKKTQKEIGKMFNCTQSNISYLLSKKTWKHLC